MINLYEVKAKCGHVGRGKFVYKIFAIKACSEKEAAAICRRIPRVKHHHKDAIAYVKKVTQERFDEIFENNRLDLYFSCTCIQDQRRYVEMDIELEPFDEVKHLEENKHSMYHSKQLIRNQKKYFNRYIAGVA